MTPSIGSWPQAVVALVQALIGAGGIGGVILLFRRHKGAPIDANEAKKAEVVDAMGDAGILDEWHKLAVQMRSDYERAMRRIDEVEGKLSLAIGYASALREDIWARREPPPREWPADLFTRGDGAKPLHGAERVQPDEE